MPDKQPTIKEIAKRLNISVSTVSRALHDHSSIGLRTKTQVKELAKELNYEPNQTAIFFQQRKTFTVGVILPHLAESFFSEAISGIEDVTYKNKYTVLLGQSHDDLEKEKQPALRFTSAKLNDSRVTFSVVETPRDDMLGQTREVRSNHKLHAIGEIESINGHEVTFSIRTSYTQSIPKIGELGVDLTLARIALDRQWTALDSVRYQRCVRPEAGRSAARSADAYRPDAGGRVSRILRWRRCPACRHGD